MKNLKFIPRLIAFPFFLLLKFMDLIFCPLFDAGEYWEKKFKKK